MPQIEQFMTTTKDSLFVVIGIPVHHKFAISGIIPNHSYKKITVLYNIMYVPMYVCICVCM